MDYVTYWRTAPKATRRAIIASIGAANADPAHDPIELVHAPGNWGVFASIGPNYQYAVFGRDSIETAEDILDTHPEIVHDIIHTLCRLQGTATNLVTEEEPGKIHHEYRGLQTGHREVPAHSRDIIRDLQSKWGEAGSNEMVYYGGHDATPLFVRLVACYCARWGNGLLDEPVLRYSDRARVTVRDCVAAALGWLATKINDKTLGLFIYHRLNPHGIVNQAWKDSETAYLHTDGSLPDRDASIASIELQGYAYDAFRAGIKLGLGHRGQQRHWRKLAERLQKQTVRLLWMEDVGYFAQGLDFSDPENPRQIATITSNPAALLDSRLLHDLPKDQAARYVEPIVRMTFSEELLTDVGIRCRAIRHRNLLSSIDYHGPNTVWPKETYDIAKGLRRAGQPELADDLETRLMRGLEQAGEFPEFLYVSRDGTVWYDTKEALAHFSAESLHQNFIVPETGQAWTIAAALRIMHEKSRKPPAATEPLARVAPPVHYGFAGTPTAQLIGDTRRAAAKKLRHFLKRLGVSTGTPR